MLLILELNDYSEVLGHELVVVRRFYIYFVRLDVQATGYTAVTSHRQLFSHFQLSFK